MWLVIPSEDFARQAKWYAKKRRHEFDAVSANLDRLIELLRDGHDPARLNFGFIHHEPAGVIAVDQTGAGRKLAATRLYVYAYVERETVFLLTIGDKQSQGDDIRFCKQSVETINANPDFGVSDANQDDGREET
jgi:hypothetical protein